MAKKEKENSEDSKTKKEVLREKEKDSKTLKEEIEESELEEELTDAEEELDEEHLRTFVPSMLGQRTSPVLQQMMATSGGINLEESIITSPVTSEREEQKELYSTGGGKKEERPYDEGKLREEYSRAENVFAKTQALDMQNIGKDVGTLRMQNVNFVNPEQDRISGKSDLETTYVQTERIDMTEIGKKRRGIDYIA